MSTDTTEAPANASTALRWPIPPADAALLAERVTRAVALLRQIERLPDAGRHKRGCWRKHIDCFAAKLDAILTRGAQ